MGTPASLLDLIAHGGSLRASQDNDALAAQTAREQAAARATQAQIPLVQQQTEQARQTAEADRLKNVLAQRQLHDEEIQRQIWAEAGRKSTIAGNGATAAETDPLQLMRAMPSEMARRGASAPAVMGAYKQTLDLQKNIAALSGDQLKLEQENHGMVADSLNGYLENQTPQAYAQFRNDAVAREPNLAAELPTADGATAPGRDQLAHVIGKVGLFGKLLTQAETKQKAATGAATATKDIAQAGEADLNRQIAEFKFNLMRSATPETLATSVDSIIDPAKYPDQNKDAKASAALALRTTGDPAKAADAVQEVARGIRQVTTQDALIPGEVRKAAQVATAVAPIEVGKAVATASAVAPIHVQEEAAKQVAMAANSPEAFGSIVNPRERTQAQQNYERDSKDYADKVSAARQLKDFVAAAESGNKAAPGLIPLAELRQIVSRVNQAELRMAGSGAGSVMDKVQGWLGGHVEGQPIPPDVLKGIKEISSLQARAARSNYATKVAITNKTFGSKVQPIELPDDFGATIRARDSKGNLHEAPAGTPIPAGWKAEP